DADPQRPPGPQPGGRCRAGLRVARGRSGRRHRQDRRDQGGPPAHGGRRAAAPPVRVRAGGVESMSRVPVGSDGGAWAMDPETNYDTSFVPQGISADLIATIEEFSRDDVDAYAVRSQERAS